MKHDNFDHLIVKKNHQFCLRSDRIKIGKKKFTWCIEICSVCVDHGVWSRIYFILC